MRNLYITAGHNIVGNKGTGAFGVTEITGKQFDEGVEARLLTDAVIAHLKRWYKIESKTDSKSANLSSVVTWLVSLVKKDDIAIEFHFNAGAIAATGTEVFIPEIHTEKEVELATLLAKAIGGRLGIPLREGKLGIPGVKTEKESQHPSIAILSQPKAALNLLVEICFITNPKNVLSYRKNYYALVQAISDTIGNYINR